MLPVDAGARLSSATEVPSPPARRAAEERITIRAGTPADRDAIYRMRHDVYARELGQHQPNARGRLSDALDAHNLYFVAERRTTAGLRLVGFVSVTPPTAPAFSVEKYLSRSDLGVPVDEHTFEIRILTVAEPHRRSLTAARLMERAFDFVRESGGRSVIIMGRRELRRFYEKVGLRPLGRQIVSGAVVYDVMGATVEQIVDARAARLPIARRVAEAAQREASRTAACYHGGAFFEAVGEDFDDLERRRRIVSADVLDAWFPPAPAAVQQVAGHLEWVLSTSPPTHGDGLARGIARARGLPVDALVLGSGSSALVFLAFRRWLDSQSRVLVLDPTYGEYAHVLERVIGCRTERFALSRADGYRVDLDGLSARVRQGYDLVVLVNPNNPTGVHVPRTRLLACIKTFPSSTRVWVDEAYVDYVSAAESLERDAAGSDNLVVCKSLSKVYALSGARVAYLSAPARLAADLRTVTPPWAVSLPAQVAAVAALADHDYYARCYRRTRELREQVASRLAGLGLDVLVGEINSVLCHLAADMPTAAEVVRRCREEGVFLRDCSTISAVFGDRSIRVAVKDADTNERIVAVLGQALGRPG